jgi:hypothetical protein
VPLDNTALATACPMQRAFDPLIDRGKVQPHRSKLGICGVQEFGLAGVFAIRI